jgi:hypothetical protein
LTGAEARFGPLALDDELMLHVVAASAEDPAESEDIADPSTPLVVQSWRQTRKTPDLKGTFLDVRKQFASKTKLLKSKNLKLARAIKLVIHQNEHIIYLEQQLDADRKTSSPDSKPMPNEDGPPKDVQELQRHLLNDINDLM